MRIELTELVQLIKGFDNGEHEYLEDGNTLVLHRITPDGVCVLRLTLSIGKEFPQ